jgi:hypothetical protein
MSGDDGNNPKKDASGDALLVSQPSAPPAPAPNIGDTQPFRPAKAYRPLTSEPPLDESDYQQTAPFKPIKQVNVPPKKGNAVPLILGVAAFLLVAVAVAAYFIIKALGSAGGGTLAVDRVLPANTLAYISINPAPAESQRQAFAKMRDAFESQPGFQEALDRLVHGIQDTVSNTGLPLLGNSTDPASLDTLSSYLGGNVTIAVLSPSRGELESLKGISGGEINPQTGLAAFDAAKRNLVGLVDLDFNAGEGSKQGLIADLRAIRDNLDKAKFSEKYRDTDIRTYNTGSIELYFSFLGGTSTAAVAMDTKPVKALIDELKNNKGLKEDTGFKALSGKVPVERMATLYLNLSEIHKSVQTVLPDFDSNSTGNLLGGFFKLNGALLLAISGQDDGAQIDVASQGLTFDWGTLIFGSTKALYANMNPNAHPDSSTFNDIPSESFVFLAGSDLKTLLTSILDSLRQSAPEQLDQLEKASQDFLGLGLREDIVPLLEGDYVISASTYNTRTLLLPPIIAQLKLSEADRVKAADAIKRAAEAFTNGGAGSFDVEGGMFYPVTPDIPQVTIIGTLSDRAMLVTDENTALAEVRAENVVSGQGKGLGTIDKWKSISSHLPEKSNLIGYLDVTTLREMIEELIERVMVPERKVDYDKTTAPFLRPLKYILLGSATDPTSTGEMSHNLTRIFIGIGK